MGKRRRAYHGRLGNHAQSARTHDARWTCGYSYALQRLRKRIDNNQILTVSHEGELGTNGGPRGDINIIVRVKKHDIFKREQDNVLIDIPITFTQATLGAELEIPMVDGTKEKYKIPDGTQTGTKFYIRGKGFPVINKSWRGDLIFTVNVQVPKKLTTEQRDLLTKLARTMNEQPPVKKRGFFG